MGYVPLYMANNHGKKVTALIVFTVVLELDFWGNSFQLVTHSFPLTVPQDADVDVSKIGVPQNGWFIMENPIKMDDLGVPLFLEKPMLSIKLVWPRIYSRMDITEYFTYFQKLTVGESWLSVLGLIILNSFFFGNGIVSMNKHTNRYMNQKSLCIISIIQNSGTPQTHWMLIRTSTEVYHPLHPQSLTVRP